MTKSAYHPFFLRPLPNLTDSVYDFFLFRSPQKLLFLPGISSDYIVKVMKPQHDMLKINTNHFAIYHPHYKEKPEMTKLHNLFLFRPPLKLSSPFAATSDCCGWTNLSVAFFSAYKSSVCIAELGMG